MEVVSGVSLRGIVGIKIFMETCFGTIKEEWYDDDISTINENSNIADNEVHMNESESDIDLIPEVQSVGTFTHAPLRTSDIKSMSFFSLMELKSLSYPNLSIRTLHVDPDFENSPQKHSRENIHK